MKNLILKLILIMGLVFCFGCSGSGDGSSGSSSVSQQDTTYMISGYITDSEDGAGITDVKVTFTGQGSVTTSIGGYYSKSGLSSGTLTVSPEKEGYNFNPSSRDVTIGPSKSNVDFIGTEEVVEYDYTPQTFEVVSADIQSSVGGVVEVIDPDSSLHNTKLTIPAGALSSDQTIRIGELSNPPGVPEGQTIVTALDIWPDGPLLDDATLEIHYSDSQLIDAGLEDNPNLKLFYYDGLQWHESPITTVDIVNNILIADISHFSYWAVTGLNGTPPEDKGTPRPGDILYRLSSIFKKKDPFGTTGWRPGHEGIYTSEREYPGEGLASQYVHDYGKYNVIEPLEYGVQYSYYQIPNTSTEGLDYLPKFGDAEHYMGAREPVDFQLTSAQRESIVNYAIEQVGKPYAWAQTAGAWFGMLAGENVKGPDSFNCVGLVEKAYEQSGANGGEGLTSWYEENVGIMVHDPITHLTINSAALTPAEHYNHTKPAGGEEVFPTILWATITPDHGPADTVVLLEVEVEHPNGLDKIDGVVYITDDGYTNPRIYINDEGIDGDIVANDGVYSASGIAGTSDPHDVYFTVTDVYGKIDNFTTTWYGLQ